MTQARSTRAARALLHLPQIDPMLAALSVWCHTEDRDAEQTVTKGDTICVGRSFPELPLREQIGVLGHHILHIALRHEYILQELIARDGAQADPDLFVLSADSFINECLLRGGHALPRPAVRLQDLHSALGDTEAISEASLAQIDLLRLYQDTLRRASNAHAYAAETGFTADIHPDAAVLQRDRRAGQWQAHMRRASQGAGAAGRGVGTVFMYLKEVPRSDTPWEQHLRGLLVRATSPLPRRSHRRPAARWIAAEADAARRATPQPGFEPALDRSTLRPRLVVCIDASGSVDRRQLSRFAGEVIAITEKSGAETHVLCFDETVFARLKVEAETAQHVFDTVPLNRDGGTSFVDVIAKADALRPSLIIVLTDLKGAFGPSPNAPVLWASPIPAPQPPPFGDVLVLRPERAV